MPVVTAVVRLAEGWSSQLLSHGSALVVTAASRESELARATLTAASPQRKFGIRKGRAFVVPLPLSEH